MTGFTLPPLPLPDQGSDICGHYKYCEDQMRDYAAAAVEAYKASLPSVLTDERIIELAFSTESINRGEWEVGIIEFARAIESEVAQALRSEIEELKERLRRLSEEMEFEGNSVAYIYQKMKAYKNSIDNSIDLFRDAGYVIDSNNGVNESIQKVIAQERQIPNGFKLVPVEPTFAMSQAARYESRFGDDAEITTDTAVHVYRAMLAAAPAAPIAEKTCKDCGEVNPAEIHTCSPQVKNTNRSIDFLHIECNKAIFKYRNHLETTNRDKKQDIKFEECVLEAVNELAKAAKGQI